MDLFHTFTTEYFLDKYLSLHRSQSWLSRYKSSLIHRKSRLYSLLTPFGSAHFCSDINIKFRMKHSNFNCQLSTDITSPWSLSHSLLELVFLNIVIVHRVLQSFRSHHQNTLHSSSNANHWLTLLWRGSVIRTFLEVFVTQDRLCPCSRRAGLKSSEFFVNLTVLWICFNRWHWMIGRTGKNATEMIMYQYKVL